MNFQYPGYQTSQNSYTSRCEGCSYCEPSSESQSNASIAYPNATGESHIYSNPSTPFTSGSSYYDNLRYNRPVDEAPYQLSQETNYCQIPGCGCNQGYWIPNAQCHFKSPYQFTYEPYYEPQYDPKFDYYQNYSHGCKSQLQYSQPSIKQNSTSKNYSSLSNLRARCSYAPYPNVVSIPPQNSIDTQTSSTFSQTEVSDNSHSEPLLAISEQISRLTNHMATISASSNSASSFIEQKATTLKSSESTQQTQEQRDVSGTVVQCYHFNEDVDSSPTIQRSVSENSQPSNEFIDVKARNMAYKLCKLFWVLTQSDWSKLCQKLFSERNTKYESFMLDNDILTQYITMLQSISLVVQAPNFSRDLDHMHQDKELVDLVENQFECLYKVFNFAKLNGEFYYYPDCLGSYGPAQNDNGGIIVKKVKLESTILEGPVNGMISTLKRFHLFLISDSKKTSEQLLPDFSKFVSNKLKKAMESLKAHNQRMGETLQTEDDLKKESQKKITPILKTPGSKSKNTKRVRFGQAKYRYIQLKEFGKKEDKDVIIDQIFESPEAFKEQCMTRRSLFKESKGEQDVVIIPRDNYIQKREIVKKTKFVKEITKEFDNPRTVLRLSPPDSPDSAMSLPFDNVSNSFREVLIRNEYGKRKKIEDVICEKFNEIKKRRK